MKYAFLSSRALRVGLGAHSLNAAVVDAAGRAQRLWAGEIHPERSGRRCDPSEETLEDRFWHRVSAGQANPGRTARGQRRAPPAWPACWPNAWWPVVPRPQAPGGARPRVGGRQCTGGRLRAGRGRVAICVACEEGEFHTLRQSALDLWRAGITTLDEVFSVTSHEVL